MRERVLELKKRITQKQNDYEYLDLDERAELKKLVSEYDAIEPNLSDADREWMMEKFADWYRMYLHNEVIGNVKPMEG